MTLLRNLALGIVLATAAPAAFAGSYSDALSKCLIAATTPQDRASLMRWLFATASNHPAVKSMATVTPTQMNDSNKSVGDLITKLLTVDCRTQAQAAYRQEGSGSFKTSFEALSEVADHELFSGPDVEASMAELRGYVDTDKIKQLVAAP
jgi:hypothetical protein